MTGMHKPSMKCTEEGCDSIAKARGLCHRHYSRQQCVVDGCRAQIWLAGTGRCKRCFQGLDPEMFAKLKMLPNSERQKTFERLSQIPEREKWEYENPEGEAELMKLNAEPENDEVEATEKTNE